MGNIQSIKDLQNMWLMDSLSPDIKDRKISKIVRIMTYKFLREECISYLYEKE